MLFCAQAVTAAAEADATEEEAGEEGARETGAAQQVRLAVYARRAVVNSACETIDRFSDMSLHALGELAATGIKGMLELEREFNTGSAPASAPQAVLTSEVPARAAAVRLVAHSLLTELRALRETFKTAATQVKDECANLVALPFEEEVRYDVYRLIAEKKKKLPFLALPFEQEVFF
ncbi:hypothetical protein T492DRAFT_248337 [Pavlovales sp. CCMP2436]|nr:hypothetical protein T492DRAFT_248337 [Pavlovales sp. CCMP2436]